MESGTRYTTSPMKSALILIAVIGGTIAFAFWFYGYVVPDTDDTTLSGHGTAALVLGVGFSLVVGVGLMALIFLSSRRGYDEGLARREESHNRESSR